jgi:hypothetical protein
MASNFSLLWPFLGFSIAATSYLVGPQSSTRIDRIYFLKCAFCAAVVLLLAKEKRILMIVAPAYVFMRMVIASIFIHSRDVFVWALISGVALFAVLRSPWVKEWKPSYVFPRRLYLLDIVVGMSGLAALLLIFQWIKP